MGLLDNARAITNLSGRKGGGGKGRKQNYHLALTKDGKLRMSNHAWEMLAMEQNALKPFLTKDKKGRDRILLVVVHEDTSDSIYTRSYKRGDDGNAVAPRNKGKITKVTKILEQLTDIFPNEKKFSMKKVEEEGTLYGSSAIYMVVPFNEDIDLEMVDLNDVPDPDPKDVEMAQSSATSDEEDEEDEDALEDDEDEDDDSDDESDDEDESDDSDDDLFEDEEEDDDDDDLFG